MKRSEMLESLYKAIDEHIASEAGGNLVDFILGKAEELGMLPPSIPTGASGWDVGKGMPTYINEWEKEETESVTEE